MAGVLMLLALVCMLAFGVWRATAPIRRQNRLAREGRDNRGGPSDPFMQALDARMADRTGRFDRQTA